MSTVSAEKSNNATHFLKNWLHPTIYVLKRFFSPAATELGIAASTFLAASWKLVSSRLDDMEVVGSWLIGAAGPKTFGKNT